MPKVIALFEAKNRLSPELVKVQREVQRSRQAVGGLDNETKRTTQALGRMGTSMDRTARGFARDTARMQREVHDLRSELNRLGSMKEKPQVAVDDKASQQLSDIKQQVLGIAGLTATIAIGTNVGGIMSENEAAYRERSRYAARGKTFEEMQLLDKRVEEAIAKNPYLSKAEAIATVSKSEQLNGKNAVAYTEQANMLGITTRFSPEEHLKMMAVMRTNTGVDDAARLSNSIQYMNNTMMDFKDEFVDSIIEYSAQTSKFLDTPEKMAALVGEIGKMGIWSDDKAFDALKESTLKLTNAGDLTNVLKTGYEAQNMDSTKALEKATAEAAQITKLLTSGDKTDQQIAMGQMMISMSTIQDKNVQQQILNELGAGPGEDLGKYFAPLLEKAGKIATGEIKPQIGNETERAYKAAVEANPLFEYQKAQNEAKQAALEFGLKLTQDVTPALTGISTAAGLLAGKFNAMPDMARYAVEWTTAAGAILLGGFMLIRSATAQLRAARALEAIARMGGGGGTDIDIGGPDKKGKGGSKKRKWYNPMSWGGKGDVPEKLFGPAEPPQKGWLSKIGDGFKDFGGKLSKGAGPLLKRIPLLGTAIGAGAILASDNKLETAAKVGTEAAGGWGGAAAGAWAGGAAGALVGSVVPVVGTAVGGAVGASIGGLLGGLGGAFGSGVLFDKVKAWWTDAPATPPEEKPLQAAPEQPAPKPAMYGPPMPNVSPAAKAPEAPKTVAVTIQQLSISLHAQGVLQDIPTMIKMLDNPTVAQKITGTVAQAIVVAADTRGGVPV